MAENKLKIEIFRKKTMEELSSALADPECRAGCGSAAAAVASIAAALLCRAAKQLTVTDENCEQAEWFVRNTEIVRSYMTNLIDEDVKCHAPLRRAQKEGEERNIEASRQAAVSICLEIVNMMGQCLDLCEGMMPLADTETVSLLKEGAELAYGASLAAGEYVLTMSALSPDETYRYVMKRENELTMQDQHARFDRIRNKNS